MGRKIKSLSGNGGSSFKDAHGYSKVGGVLKSKDTKMALEKKQLRMNAFKAGNVKGKITDIDTVPKGENKYRKFVKMSKV
jgi:hypothetical protein